MPTGLSKGPTPGQPGAQVYSPLVELFTQDPVLLGLSQSAHAATGWGPEDLAAMFNSYKRLLCRKPIPHKWPLPSGLGSGPFSDLSLIQNVTPRGGTLIKVLKWLSRPGIAG